MLRPRGPFDLALSLRAAASFFPIAGPPPAILRMPIQLADEKTAIVEVSQAGGRPSGLLYASSTARWRKDHLRAIVRWLVSADLDLRPFYVLAEKDLIMRADARLRDLGACGLSRRKSEYIRALARRMAEGGLDLEALKRESDQRIREDLLRNRGFGEWSAQYILSRGFGRPDILPSADIGLRRAVGHYFANGRRLTAAELEDALAQFKPFRGLAAFYLAVHWRLPCPVIK